MERNATPPPPARKRMTLIDILAFSAVLGLIVFAVYRVNEVLVYNWDWSRVLSYILRVDDETGQYAANLLLYGLATTLRLAVWGTVLASVFGVVMGLWRTSDNLTLRILSRSYVELIRNLPPLVFIFIFYFFVSSQMFPAMGIDNINPDNAAVDNRVFRLLFGDPQLLPNFLAGALCLALFEGAYITEIVRAGIQSIAKGQWEAARAIGLSRFNVLRDVILPQALRRILPPLAGQFITLIKDSAIVSLISIQELTFMATEVAATTTKVFETWILVGGIYFVLCYSFALFFGTLERRASKTRR
ncbi:amino acid ABC transporter membrane protein 2, PAAT family [Paracoccus seriniphilus]|uniref:Amino acid ABC transporter membrane protein 2, PAAT family n=2 Tax=Paracoccus seriniphilus TaxID=184748 RepID=A0A239Q2Q6_9RHOB|nr:amino acid ABC transporter permease [Paracoccus seriniphilus]SNT76546.1 amino acid ABC transporter membrane protein 2, PAAT family [Paracoccus seriniphilus]